MKLMVCIVNNYYADNVEKQLRKKGYRMTELASTGGFMRKGNTTFLFGIDEEHIDTLKVALQEACLEVEQVRGKRKGQENRYTSFLVDANPMLAHILT
ncbi:cyclic-di-AMP receptor [Bacillus alkalicellulosilyticus]|uniref:cyclic-di-AMP receptor n=1 Tax=Alkalihalobacterium alkalicellulosilyticum TaxID=1912214 RepID=UPI0009968DBA|nr:cyclic-di-AMP receptor [Bacillus alkalicellulosilyticus]